MELSKEQQLYQTIVNEAWENEDFKAELLKDPAAAIEKLTGERLNLPEGKTLVVRDQTDAATVYINIPAEQRTDDVELNEEQLEAVAGGLRIPLTDYPFFPYPKLPTFPKGPMGTL
ncbi:NHLP leader peptide family RiPP precursor [Sungkyunkwania multivorans]|uniref:NHLP leader peptide family RiPP n=1 Tax=Sungkyunkwania multivorans TaxID=1173618 RepID=A0ABW3D1I2_9FLAO